MATAIIGTGGIGSAIARQLAAGGEALKLSSAQEDLFRTDAKTLGMLLNWVCGRPRQDSNLRRTV